MKEQPCDIVTAACIQSNVMHTNVWALLLNLACDLASYYLTLVDSKHPVYHSESSSRRFSRCHTQGNYPG